MNQAASVSPATKAPYKARYDNFIGGRFVAPLAGQYFDNTSPVNGQVICQIARKS